MNLTKISLYYYTIKHLKPKQLFYQLYYKIYRPKVDSSNINPLKHATPKGEWGLHILHDKRYFLDKNTLNFLNQSSKVDGAFDWNDRNKEKLWLYNLHYFEGLSAKNKNQQELTYQLLLKWNKENQPGQGNGWEPYPLSLRIVNVVKYILLGNTIDKQLMASLYMQARYLNKMCEYHLLGNHLFENFKALCFAGLFFEGSEADEWFKKGLKGLQKEIPEQILPDGGHFELSPMYHSLILEGLLDLYNAFQTYSVKGQLELSSVILSMLDWLKQMSRNEQSVSYFNDAADGIAPTPAQLCDYAKRLGFKPDHRSINPGLTHLSASGYIVYKSSRAKAILDTAPIGPDYLPGHAHADNLSFEFILDGFPVMVNSGTSCYGRSKRRYFERSTQAHNTLAIEGYDSSEVWSGFRVAKRAKTRLLEIISDKKKQLYSVKAAHHGYQRVDKKAIHQRQWQFKPGNLVITDWLGGDKDAGIFLHLHPQCKIEKTGRQHVTIKLPNQTTLQIQFEETYEVLNNQYANSFGQLQSSTTFKYQLGKEKRTASTTIFWDE